MKKIILFVLLVPLLAGFCMAGMPNTENDDGVAYGTSQANRDTAVVVWQNLGFVSLQNYESFSVVFKVLTAAADTVWWKVWGTNQRPDSSRFYYLILKDSLYTGAWGDSTMAINLPYGTGRATAVLPNYIKIELILADTTSGVLPTATIADSYIKR